VENADQFEPRIKKAIEDSSFLVVVLSRNWVTRRYCRQELDAFAERWARDPGLLERIIVVGKRHIDPERRPVLLQGQVGFAFYSLEDPDDRDAIEAVAI